MKISGQKMSTVLSCIIYVLICGVVEACWGNIAPRYGEMTGDYDLLVGSELVLNCTLKSKIFPKISDRPISSSDLIFEKGNQDFTNFTQQVDDLTIQLKIPSAKVKDSGLYYCKIFLPNEKPVVCGSKVSVGYPPRPVRNFTCISKNYDSLNCSWITESSTVLTKYTIVKYYLNVESFEQKCPDTNATEKRNFCLWTTETEPKYSPLPRNVSFSIKGNNSLGYSIDKFTLDGFSIVIPNSPENIQIVSLSNQSITIGWKPPAMRNFAYNLSMTFQIWIRKHGYNSTDIKIFEAGNNTSKFTIEDLIPYVLYDISIRCRSVFAKGENMWSPFVSIKVQTLPDVPYTTPEVISEAYELHQYDNSRSVLLYWKSVPELFHNGKNFHYYIKYTNAEIPRVTSVNSSSTFIEITKLSKNVSYIFHIHSANKEGISKNYESIFVNTQDKILTGPKYITAISQDLGHYNLSWEMPNNIHDVSFIVFWCASLKPWFKRCDSSVHWISENLTENSIILNLTDIKTNFQFAVVSKTEISSSGMQWASCIVPHKAALGKIKNVVVEQKNSTSLKVIWYLDCDAQKAVVKRYEIIYCRLNKNEKCKVDIVGSNAKSHLLSNLYPFSNYSIKIRAFNKDNLPSEDSDAKLKETLPGAPSGPPQNVTIFLVSNSSFTISWAPPLEPNGNVTKYIISYNDSTISLTTESNDQTHTVEINGLSAYTIYVVQIKACVENDCSNKSEPVMVQTSVGKPGHMDPPRIEIFNSTQLKISWSAPSHPNGPIDFYIIEWHEKIKNASYSSKHSMKVSGALSVFLELNCSRLEDLGVNYLFYIRAVNLNHGASLLGSLSESIQVTTCIISQRLAMIIGIAIGGTLALALLVLLFYKLIKWMREKIHQVKSITIKLPKGLEGPEANPLKNYECFKHGLNENIQENSFEKLSYVIEENENKNRHGSGSSHFSNSSTEELIFKNGKCTKFGRKPSGDSSGCSSMSSSTTPRTHLSSDSGTESDFIIPPSPDSAITEQSIFSSHKSPLPILMEVHDQLSVEQTSSSYSVLSNEQSNNGKNTTDDMMIKVDKPYSKFGIAGNFISSPRYGNPLAFYSCNLANSEPSVFNIQKTEEQGATVAAYSKIGLAKSSGDIMGMSLRKEIGYSKFGYQTPQKRFSIPSLKINSMSENPDLEKWEIVKKNLKLSLKDLSKVVLTDCDYIKYRIDLKKQSLGYVPFNDLKGLQDQTSLTSSLKDLKIQVDHNPVDSKDLFHVSSIDKNPLEISNNIEWSHNTLENNNENLTNLFPEIVFDNSLSQDSVSDMLNNSIYSSLRLPKITANFESSFQQLPIQSDIKNCINTLPLNENTDNNFVENVPNGIQNINHSLFSNEKLPLAEHEPYIICSGKKDDCDKHNEAITTSVTLRNGYVPFSTLSDCVCDTSHSHLPNVSKSDTTFTVFSNNICTKIDNYVTPSNKGDLKHLRDNSASKSKPKYPFTNVKQNRNGYTNRSLNYNLKPYPKMESEVCEV